MAFSLEIDGPDRERILRTKASFPGAQKKQGSGKLMSKGFGTQPESKISNTEFLKEETEDQQGHMTSLPPSLGGGYEYPGAQVVRPLEHRMEPRDEFATFHLPRKYDRSPLDSDSLDSNSLISPITEARNRGDTNAILTGRISDEDLEHSGEEGSLNDVSFEQALPRPKSLDVTNKQQIEYVAVMNAHDKKGTENWRYYLECYVKGQFALINPPPPPQCSGNFKYLSAVYPPNEAKRLSLCAKYDIIWRQQAEFDKVGSFLKDAINRFDARYGSLSFFDDRYEDIKIENGYGRSRIDRHISIAAHVLYSSDVLVILDTKQDWRFENNPLVLAKPKIRFFAGAPLISTEGEVVGVLAIFGKEPRTAFTPQQRKELAEFSSEIVKELDSMADTLSDPKWRTTPLLERDSVINGMYARRDFNSPPRPFSAEKAQSNIIPSALHYHMSKSSTSSKSSRHYFGSKNNFGRDAEPTPPPSAESNYNSFFDNPQSFGKNHEQLCEDPVMNDNSVLEHQTTLSRQYLRVSTPRPFSSSDITSLNIHPPNTPDRSLNDEDLSHQPRFDLTFENFLSLSDADCAEEPRVEQVWEDNLIDKVIRSQKEGNQQRHTPHNARFNANTSGTSLETSEVNAKAWNTPVKDSFAGHSIPDATSSPLIDLSNPPRERGNLMALAPFPSCPMDDLRSGVSTSSIETIKLDPAEECREFNEQHDFDLIYCVEIKPALPYFMTDQELLADNGLRKRVLIAYGLPFEHSDLNSRNHLEALRSEDCKRWNNPKMHYGEFDYATGYMVPVHAEGGPRGLRTAGIVLGVFRKERIYEAYRNTRHEKQLVMEFAQKLSRMLVKSPQPTIKRPQTEPVSPGHVQPQPIFKRSHTDPVAHSPFLANEAREVTLSEESGYGYSINARYLGAYPRNETLGTTFAIEHTPQYLTTTRHVCGYSPGQVGEAMFGNENTPQYPTNTHYVAAYQPGQAREAKFNDEHPLQYPRHFVTDLTNEAADGTSGAEPTYPMNLTQDPPKKARGGNRKLKKFVKNVGAQMVQTIGSGGYV